MSNKAIINLKEKSSKSFGWIFSSFCSSFLAKNQLAKKLLINDKDLGFNSRMLGEIIKEFLHTN